MKPRRTARRCFALALLMYALIFCKRALRRYSRQSGTSDVRHVLKNTVDRVLDEVASDLLLSEKFFVIKPSRKDFQRILNLQSALSYSIEQGIWNHGLPSNTPPPTFIPNFDLLHPRLNHTMPNIYENVCSSLSGKRIALIGPDTTFHLHSLWLSALEAHEGRTHTCFGRDFCTFHHICLSRSTEMPNDLDQMSGRKKKIPSANLLLDTKSSLLQYALSTTLHASKNQDDTAYTLPMVDDITGVRVPNTYWLRRARKADIAVFNRGPVPAPAWTYSTNGEPGNWSFTKTLCATHNHLDFNACDETLDSRLTNAALHATIDVFLPSLLRFLCAVAQDSEIMSSLLLWHGSWYIQPLCARAGMPRNMPLLRDVWSQDIDVGLDPWSFYYNSQVYMHDQLLPKVLPYFNMTYIPLTIPAYMNPKRSIPSQKSQTFSPLHPKDCIRKPWPSFGRNLERMFLNGLAIALSDP